MPIDQFSSRQIYDVQKEILRKGSYINIRFHQHVCTHSLSLSLTTHARARADFSAGLIKALSYLSIRSVFQPEVAH